MQLRTPRLTIAGLAGDGGKTLVTLGLARSMCDRGMAVAAYKKGPDYIDAAWLGAATRGAGRNLDTFLMGAEGVLGALRPALGADLVVVEGNRGLFDGSDAAGSHSTAVLARLIASPIVLVVDVTKTTRTAAALVVGCATFEPGVPLAGVILNRVATARQEKIIREAIESASGVPVLGAIPRLRGGDPLPSRHLGLVTAVEHPAGEEAIVRAAAAVASGVDLDRMAALAAGAGAIELPSAVAAVRGESVRIAIVRDEAFSFYYPENLEALETAGAEIVAVSALGDEEIPDVQAIYVGGGFPEVYAERLASSRRFLRSLRTAAAAGVPVYAECGGLMLLARTLEVGGRAIPMAGVLDLDVAQSPNPQGHGYVEAIVEVDTPFFAGGTVLRGHEFHYSSVLGGKDAAATVARLTRGKGMGGGRDGVVRRNVWASYFHIHVNGCPEWAEGLLAAARGERPVRRGTAVGWA